MTPHTARRPARSLLPLLPALLLGGCDWLLETGDTSAPTSDEDFRRQEFSGESADGLFDVPVRVRAGDAAFLVTGTSDRFLSVEELLGPDGSVVVEWQQWQDRRYLTNAFYVVDETTSFNWPIRGVDTPLTPGTWTLRLATTNQNNSYVSGIATSATAQIKRDRDLASGTARVRLVYAAGLDEDPVVVAGIEAAVERWREIWAQAGMQLELETQASALDPALSSPGDDPAALREASAGIDGEVVVVIGDDIDGSTGYYGIAGGIPGSLLPGPRSAVVVSWIACAGRDLEFSADDIELTAETLAHEVGHFQGLAHPVELNFNSWDALDDTPECSAQRRCENDLGTNFMYPTSICDNSGCVNADQITTDQAEVLQRYAGTD